MEKTASFANVQSMNLDNYTVTAIPDGGAYIQATTMYPTSDSEEWGKHTDLTDDSERVVVTVGGFLIEAGDKKILMDLGYGPQIVKFPGFGPFIGGKYLASLAETDVDPEEITDVVFTHLHCDHTGWTSVEKDGVRQLTFPNAAYWCSQPEWEYWVNNPGGLGPDQEVVLDPLKDVIRFAVEGQEIAPGLFVHITPGHTPGLLILELRGEENTLWFTSDIFHSTVQFREKPWYTVFDIDHETAAETRAHYLPAFLKENAVLADCHFSDHVFGKLEEKNGKLVWIPIQQ